MPATSMRWCPSCQEWFTPDRYNAWHQHYCTRPRCRAASHVSRRLGHERLDTLRHYVRLNIADIQKTHRQTHPRERDEMSREEGDPQPQPQ